MHRDSLSARRRYTRLAGSADALALARLAHEEKPLARRQPPPRSTRSAWSTRSPGSRPACASPAARLGDAALRPVLAAPGPGVRAARHAVPHPARRLRRRPGAGADRAGAPGPPAYLAGAHVPPQASGERSTLEKLRAQLATRRLPARHAGGRARRVLRPRRADRPVPDGQRRCPTASTCSTTRSIAIRTFDLDTQRTLYPVKEVRLLPAREFPLDEDGARASAAAGASCSRAIRRRSALQGRVERRARRRHRVLPAAVLRADATLFDYLPAGTRARPAPRRDARRVEEFWRDTARATRWPAATRPAAAAAAELFLPAEEFFVRAQGFRAHRPRRQRGRRPPGRLSSRRRCRRSRSTAAPRIRCTR